MMRQCGEGMRRAGVRELWFLAGIVGLVAIVRFVLACRYELFPDEMLYAWLSHVAPLNFCPHPPGASIMARAGMAMLGKTEIGVRIFSFILATLTIMPVYLLARDIGGARIALWSLLTITAVPMYFGFGAILTPDGAQLFMWSWILWFTYRSLQSDGAIWWIMSGLALGAALFFKYIIILYYPSLVLCLLLHPVWRVRLRSPRLFLGMTLSLVPFLSLAAWADHATDWSALRYHLSARQEFTPFSLTGIGVYQGFHFLYISPLLYLSAVAAMVWSGWRGVRANDGRLVFLFSFSATTYMFFAVISSVTRRYLSREQWDALAYVPALIAAVMMFQYYSNLARSSAQIRIMRGVAIAAYALCIVIIVGFLFEAATGWASRLLGENPAIETQIGWREMSRAADSHLNHLPTDKPGYLLGNNFTMALAYAFYGGTSAPIYTLDHKDNTMYGLDELLLRGGVGQPNLARELGHHAIFVVEDLEKVGDGGQKRLPKLKRMFASVENLPTVEIRCYGSISKRFHMFRCLNMKYEPGKGPVKE